MDGTTVDESGGFKAIIRGVIRKATTPLDHGARWVPHLGGMTVWLVPKRDELRREGATPGGCDLCRGRGAF